jgi:DNA-binding transcriptional MocR family regulator
VLPADALASASAEILSNPTLSVNALEYGPHLGDPQFREAVASWLSFFYDPSPDPVTAERICITAGASQSLANILQTYTDVEYTKAVWMITPTYYRAYKIFEDNGFRGRIRSVPEDNEDIDIDAFQKLISDTRNNHGVAKAGVN